MNKLSKRIDAGGRSGSSDNYTYVPNKVEMYSYLADGSTSKITDRNGITTSYSYDIHGRCLSKSAGDNTISYTYDNAGNQLTVTDSIGTTVRKYDELGRVISKNVPTLGTNTYLYDKITDVTAGYNAEVDTDAKGNVTTKAYDKVGRISEVRDGSTQTAAYDYFDNGNQKSIVYPGVAREDYTYYKDNQLKTLTNKKNDGSSIDTYSYVYDSANNMIKKTDGKGDTLYAYDALNRLSKVTEPSGKITEYTFDAAGNRATEKTTQNSTQTLATYNYNEQDRMTSKVTVAADGSKETVTYSYDPNGNMTRKATESTKKIDPANPPTGSFGMFIYGQSNFNPKLNNLIKGTATYEYDTYNQMTKAVTGDGTSNFKYNGEGLRVEKTVNGATTKYLYESDKVVLETDGKGKQTARNIQGNNLISRTVDSQKMNYLYNGHADVTSLIDSTGSIKGTYYYDAFGTPVETTGTNNNPYTYAGYQYDKETGLYYLNSRMYDSTTARFMQEDTYDGEANDPLSLNLYTYCKNEPIMYSDPTGHYSIKDLIDPIRNGSIKAQDMTMSSDEALKVIQSCTQQPVPSVSTTTIVPAPSGSTTNNATTTVSNAGNATTAIFDASSGHSCGWSPDFTSFDSSMSNASKILSNFGNLDFNGVGYSADGTSDIFNEIQTGCNTAYNGCIMGASGAKKITTAISGAGPLLVDLVNTALGTNSSADNVTTSKPTDSVGSNQTSNPSYPNLYKNGRYDRDAAVAYATNPDYSSPDENGDSFLDWKKHTRDYNHDYERYDSYSYYLKGHLSGSDCANFVSQALYAGGVKQTNDWYFKWLSSPLPSAKSLVSDASGSWIRPDAQLNYLKSNGYINGDVITVNSVDEMRYVVKNYDIQKGDVMYFENNKEGIHHSVMITKIGNDGTIYFSGHSNDRINQEVIKDTFRGENGAETILIARMK